MTGQFRIATWNCNGGKFDIKGQMILDLNPDIAIIQEIAKPNKMDQSCFWTASRVPFKGVAVIARNGFSVSPYPLDMDVPPMFVPVIINGPVDFHLLAVWTQNEGQYIKSFKAAFEHYREFLLEKPSVIAGDFNSNTIWDHQYPDMNHSMVVQYCERELGLVSSYHKKIPAAQGKELHPTYYQNRNSDRPYHIDYCFVPESWEINQVEIGTHDEWHNKSDHCPVIVDITIRN